MADVFVLTQSAADHAVAIAGSRAGAVGVLNLEHIPTSDAVRAALEKVERLSRNPYGVLLGAHDVDFIASLLSTGPGLRYALISIRDIDAAALKPALDQLKERQVTALAVVTDVRQSEIAEEAGFDGLIAKGAEAGGWVGEETAFVLVQHVMQRTSLPVWLQGGIGLHTAAAAIVAGAAGVVLDSQLLLAREASTSPELRARLENFDGSETQVIGGSAGAQFRAFARQGSPTLDALRRLEASESLQSLPEAERRRVWRGQVQEHLTSDDGVWGLGQDAAFAAPLARRFVTVGGIVQAVRDSIQSHVRLAKEQQPLAEGNALAQAHRTRYPVVQGPMTRVSDRAEFAEAVANGGGLPFLALALMRREEATPLLEQTKALLGEKSWGVGILGFVPPELRAEQLEQVLAYKPPFALIAGGRPDQAKVLEAAGIATYLHVPSPGLLNLFLADGARRFVFEGRECGGHVGPRTSFVLWESMIDTILEYLDRHPGTEGISVLFAGGVHDGLSAAMVSAMAAPLVERGVAVGVLAGTAYLFTREAVEAGAIQQGFQDAAVACESTVTLEAVVGYATRCLPSPFVETFETEKRRLILEEAAPEDLKEKLELLNIGRLRIASKGVDRNPDYGTKPDAPRLIDVAGEAQWRQGMYMIGQVAALNSGVRTVAQLHEEISNGSVRHLQAIAEVEDGDPYAPPPTAVAIVGMATIVPGASDLETFWANILDKVDAVTEVPPDRWDPRDYFDPDRNAKDKVYSKWGGFIDEVPFDPIEFGMPPNSLPSIEPFQLLALSVVRDALKDAGYAERPFARETTSVVFGAGGGGGDLTNGYVVRANLPMLFGDQAADLTSQFEGTLPEWTEDSFAGLLMNVAAGRIANRFNFGGSNFTVDAACASSLAAIYLAVRDLESHTSDVVVAGGVDAIQSPFGFLCFSRTQALSPSGHSRPFDADADGIAISEGFAAVVLKRLEDAERDGDRIYAVIRGVGASSDGRARGLTAPLPAGQVRAFRRAYANARFSPSTVELIEAHGTGTVAGDQSEIESLTRVFSEVNAPRQGTAVGSIKSMIGHTKATAGVAGLIKTAKALHHRVLPPTLGVTTPNPTADFENSPFYVNTEARPWVHGNGETPRRAGVSAFGFGGTNFHIALEEYRDGVLDDEEPSTMRWPAELLLWRADTREELLAEAGDLLSRLEQGARPRLPDLAYTTMLQYQANQGSRTLSIVAESLDELQSRLQQACEMLQGGGDRLHTPQGVHYAEDPLGRDGKVAFLFPGQGSQYLNMGRDLAVVFPEVRAGFDRADEVLGERLGQALSRYVFPPPWFQPEKEKALQAALTATNVAQPALGATSLAMLRLLEGLGVRTDMTAGHSYGEFVALHAAGVLTEEALLEVSEARGRFMAESTGEDSGAMAALPVSAEALGPLLEANPEVNLANLNSPRQTVISGPTAAIEGAIEWASEHGLAARRLPVACAFHSPLVQPAQARLAEFMGGIEFAPPRVSVFSNTTAAAHSQDPESIRQQLAAHLASPVEFVQEIEAMYSAGARVFVEVGPRQVLSGLTGQILGDRPHAAVALDNPSKPGIWPLLNALAHLASEGVEIEPARLFRGRDVRRLDVARLENETGRPGYSPTTWMVSGGSARPASSPPRQPVRQLRIRFDDGARPAGTAPDASSNGAEQLPQTAVASQAPVSTTSPVAAPEPAALPTGVWRDDGMMHHFQQVMQQFLHSQESVMTGVFSAGQMPQVAPFQSHSTEPAPSQEPGLQPPPAAGEAVREPASDGRKAAIRRFVPVPVSIGTAKANASLDSEGVVLIVDGGEVARELRDRVEARGYRCALVGSAMTATNGHGAPIVLAEDAGAAEVDAAVAELHAGYGRVSALVCLTGLEAEPDVDTAAALKASLARSERLFLLTKALLPDLSQSSGAGAAVLGATALGGRFGFGGLGGVSRDAWLPGFLKSLAQELPSVRVKAIDFAQEDAPALSQRVLDELLTDDGVVEVGYDSDGSRQRIELVEDPGSADVPALPEGAVVLVTGGARGITAECAIALAGSAPATFLLVGRTPLNAEPEPAETATVEDERELKLAIMHQLRAGNGSATPAEIERRYSQLVHEREVRNTIERLTEAGAEVHYEVADIQDEAGFGELIERAYQQFGRIDYVIHGAGVIEDRLLQDKSAESFRRVMATKVSGAAVLARHMRPDSLRGFAMFSSISGRMGNRGQVDYAAANESLNKLAQVLNATWPGRVVALNWGPWASKGMVSPEVERQFAAHGVALIPVEQGTELFVRELLSEPDGPAEVVIGGLRERPAVETSQTPGAISDAGSTVAVALPMFGPVQGSALAVPEGLTMVRTLSTEVDRYLADHVLDGRPVQPFSFAVEAMAEAAKAAVPALDVLEVRDVRLLQGIVLNSASQQLEARVTRRPAVNGDSGKLLYNVALVSDARVYYSSVVEMGQAGAGAIETDLPRPNLGEPGTGPLPVPLAEAYEEWLFHGPLLRAIEAIEAIGPYGVRARLRRSDPSQCIQGADGDWMIDPVLVDAALQLQLLWARLQWDVTLLPARARRYVPLSGGGLSSPPDVVTCEMTVRAESFMPICRADYVFYTAAGDPIGALFDVEGVGSASLNRLSRTEKRSPA